MCDSWVDNKYCSSNIAIWSPLQVEWAVLVASIASAFENGMAQLAKPSNSATLWKKPNWFLSFYHKGMFWALFRVLFSFSFCIACAEWFLTRSNVIIKANACPFSHIGIVLSVQAYHVSVPCHISLSPSFLFSFLLFLFLSFYLFFLFAFCCTRTTTIFFLTTFWGLSTCTCLTVWYTHIAIHITITIVWRDCLWHWLSLALPPTPLLWGWAWVGCLVGRLVLTTAGLSLWFQFCPS